MYRWGGEGEGEGERRRRGGKEEGEYVSCGLVDAEEGGGEVRGESVRDALAVDPQHSLLSRPPPINLRDVVFLMAVECGQR